MLENTPENKARFINQYSGLGIEMECIAVNFKIENRTLNGVILNANETLVLCLGNKNRHIDFYDIDEWILPLTPLSQITDEHATWIALDSGITIDELMGNVAVSTGKMPMRTLKDSIALLTTTDRWNAKQYQQMQEWSYLLPYHDLSTEELLSRGWAKEREVAG